MTHLGSARQVGSDDQRNREADGIAEVATFTIRVADQSTVGLAKFGAVDAFGLLMLVFVVAEVLPAGVRGFMAAIRRDRAPGQLELDQDQQQSNEPAAHGPGF